MNRMCRVVALDCRIVSTIGSQTAVLQVRLNAHIMSMHKLLSCDI